MIKLQPGLNECSNAEYHADKEYVSSSGLKVALKDIALFKHQIIDGNRPEFSNKAALEDGSLTHALLLEPHNVHQDFVFWNGLRKSGNQWETFVAELSSDDRNKVIISKPQRLRVDSYIAAFKRRKEAVNMLTGGFAEQTICGEIDGVKIKVRFDYINVDLGIIYDIKTTGKPADLHTFKQTATDLSYQLSAALYCRLAEQYYGRKFDFIFIVISKQDPQDCQLYKTSAVTMAEGNSMVDTAISKIKSARETGIYSEKLTDEAHQSDSINLESSYEILEV